MNRAWLRFYEELNDFLPEHERKQLFVHSFKNNPSVKDLIESIGVPHVEVDMILVNGLSVGFSYKVNDEDHISVYPVFETLDISNVQHLRNEPLRVIKYFTDVHLGRLARYLRMAGFDTLYGRKYADKEIVEISIAEKRIILTRDKMLLKYREISHGYWVRSTDPVVQMREVTGKFNLQDQMKPFTRCIECNTLIKDISKDEIFERIPAKTRLYYNVFKICPGCDRIYWEGSHYEKMKIFTEDIRKVK
jgi:uncharacterized protein